jgi:glycosyltransferase involved in cell wall biosynthesis
MKGKRIILTVTNDLVADQRVHRAAATLERQGSNVLVLGRKLPGSQPVGERSYRTHRMRLLFRRGALFYASFNIRLFFALLFRRADLLVSNDLDTLPACFLASRLKSCALTYDSHEYFTEVPELIGRRFARNTWMGIEKLLLPRVRYASTVSQSVADAYRERYGIEMDVIRNLPLAGEKEARRPDLLDCGPQRIIIYQGALNVGRGLESMISAMKYLDAYQLQIFGDGDIAGQLKDLTKKLELEDRVVFMGRIAHRELKAYTRQASLGISLEEDMGLNYRYALPNKIFDYIQAGVPVLVSDLPEMKQIVENYGIGQVLVDREADKIAVQVREMMDSDELRMTWKKNLRKAGKELNWEKEEEKLLDLYRKAFLNIQFTGN